MNLCIFDDEILFQNVLNDMVEDCLDINYPELRYNVHCFATTSEMLDFISKNSVDIAFLDITTKIDENDGLFAARRLRALDEKAHIIFVTSRKDKIAQSFDGLVRPTEFLIKPLVHSRVHELLHNILRQLQKSVGCLSLKFGRTEYLLRTDEIICVQKSAHKMVVLTEDKSIEVTNTIRGLLDILPEHFVQIDKGVIVNLNFADKIDYAERSIALKNGISYTISRNARPHIKNRISRLSLGGGISAAY